MSVVRNEGVGASETTVERHSEIGGLLVDDFGATWPFGYLEADTNGIRVHFGLGPYAVKSFSINRADIVIVRAARAFLGRGIRIEYKPSDSSQEVVFWSRDIELLTERLAMLGYHVQG